MGLSEYLSIVPMLNIIFAGGGQI